LGRKGLKVSPEKSKVMMFEKGRGGMKKRTWKWKRIKEIKEIKYLEYTLSKNEGAEKHIRERRKQ